MMNTDLAGYLLWLPAGLAAVGAGLLTLGLGRWGLHLARAWTRKRLWHTLQRSISSPPTTEDVYGIPPLLPWIALSAGVGWGLSYILLSGPLHELGLLAGTLPLVWKQQRLREGKQQVRREVAELVEHLRLYLAFAPTPGAALRLVIQDAPEGILWRQLRRELDTILMDGPDVALHHVSEVLAVPVLRRLVARVKAAQAGSTDLTTALQAATEEMTLDLRRELEEQVEAAPTRLLIPMLVMLMVPLLFLVLTPPVQLLLDTLAGVGPTPLGG